MGFSHLNHPESLINRIQEAVGRAFDYIDTVMIRNDKRISVAFTAANADVSVTHGLNAVPRGWFVVGNNAAASLYDGSQSSSPNLTWNLKASAICTATVVFF